MPGFLVKTSSGWMRSHLCDDKKQRWRLPEAHSDWRWKLCPLIPAWNEEGEQRLAPFLPTNTQIISHTRICGKSDDDAILGSRRPTCRVLHVQGDCSHPCLILQPPWNHLRPEIKSKRRGLLNPGVLMMYDNARLHTARVTAKTIRHIHFECLPHPPYLPYFVPCHYYIFGPPKGALGGQTFRSN
jgi:hypothetical protein